MKKKQTSVQRPKKKETVFYDWEDEVLDSIIWWEHMHKRWAQDAQWMMTAPNYGELCAKIVASKYAFIEARKSCEIIRGYNAIADAPPNPGIE